MYSLRMFFLECHRCKISDNNIEQSVKSSLKPLFVILWQVKQRPGVQFQQQRKCKGRCAFQLRIEVLVSISMGGVDFLATIQTIGIF